MKHLRQFSNTQEYDTAKAQGLALPNVSLIKDSGMLMYVKGDGGNEEPKPEVITFSMYDHVAQKTYNISAIKGSTWEEFVNSEYNTIGFKISGNYIIFNKEMVWLRIDDDNVKYILKTNIVESKSYENGDTSSEEEII